MASNVPEWSDVLSIDLISRVREHENLWDPLNPDKNKIKEKIISWKKIAKAVGNGKTSEDCQKKWTNLCQCYRAYRRGRHKKGSKANDLPIRWFAFDAMNSFMNDVYKPKENNGLNDLNENFDDDADMDIDENHIEQVWIEDSTQDSDTEVSASRSNSQELELPHAIVKLHKLHKARKVSQNSRKVDRHDMMKDACQHVANKASDSQNPELTQPVYKRKKEEDECDIFGKLMAEKLRHLDELTREYAMRDIYNIMFHAKLNPQTSTTSHHSNSP